MTEQLAATTVAPDADTASSEAWILSLHDPAATDVQRAGAKAANLARLITAGFPVPEGIVLTTAVFPVGRDERDPAEVGEAALPQSVAAALARALATFGDAPLAIRSSGVAEDLGDASFAGQYETVLGARGYDAVMEGVRRCWASAFSARVATYRGSRDVAVQPLAVLIQRLIDADAAGVAFTANPVTGERGEVAVSAVRGLGERLVSGAATPDEWTVRDGRPIQRAAPENAIGPEAVLAVADLARQAEAHFGAPQDIEWAMQDGALFLLQARPITTLSQVAAPALEPLPADVPSGFWERETSHFPQPLSPFLRSFHLEIENRAFRQLFEDFSMLLDGIELREIGGWVYQRVVPFGGQDRRPPPPLVWKLMVRLVPPLRSRIARCVDVMRADVPWHWATRWYDEWKPWLIDRIRELRLVDLTRLDDQQLAEHMEAVRNLYRQGFDIHMRINGVQNVLLAEFFFACGDLLGWDEVRAVDLLSGLSDASSAPARHLAALAARAGSDGRLGALLQRIDATTLARMSDVDPEFGRMFERYRDEFGCRPIRYELVDPTVEESPQWVLTLVRDQMRHGYDPSGDAAALAKRRATLAADARAALADRPTADRERFERALSRAERVYPLREEHGIYDFGGPAALMRYVACEFGSRLAGRSQIDQRDDVFFLEIDEACAALTDGRPRRELVRRRRDERSRALAHLGPASYGPPAPPPPSFAALPAEARALHEEVLWAIERIFATAASGRRQSGDHTISGIGASAGTYTGPVRVIRDESEFGKIKPGDVLVCPITSPVWSIVFPTIGGLVTDSGGILSHSAIIAREYRIPAVVATGNATASLHDGQRVTVDGTEGMIRVRPREVGA